MRKNTFQQGQSTPCALQYILYGLINPVSNLNYYGPRRAAAARTLLSKSVILLEKDPRRQPRTTELSTSFVFGQV